MAKFNRVFIVLISILFPCFAYSQSVATKANTGYGLYLDRTNWISWDLNGNGATDDELVGGTVTRTYIASSGLVYTIKLSNVKVYSNNGSSFNTTSGVVTLGNEIKNGTNYTFKSASTTSWAGNNFQYGYGGTSTTGWSNGNIIGMVVENWNMVTFRLTVQVNYPTTLGGGLYNVNGYASGIVIAGTESLNGSSAYSEWEQYSIPSTGKLQLIDKYIGNASNDCSNFNLKLYQNSTSNQTTMSFIEPYIAGVSSDGKGDVMVLASNTSYVDCMLKGGSAQHIAVGFIDDPNFSQAPASYGQAIHLDVEKFSGGIPATTPYTFNTNKNISDSELAATLAPIRLGAVDAVHTSYSPANASADPVTHTNGEHYADGLLTNNTFNNQYSITYTNTTSSPAYLTLWIDKNRDGAFDNSTEKFVQSISANTSGTAVFDVSSLNLPVAANYYARFRISSQSGLSPSGYAPDGEVEDYWLSLSSVIAESGAVCASGGTAITNVTSNDKVSGVAVTLGNGGNATISQSGTWPAGITLDTNTGAINVAAGTTSGTYSVTYQLCDKLTPQSCGTVTDQVIVYPLPTSSITTTPVSCNGGSNGAINVKGVGGAGSYIFSKDNGSNYTAVYKTEDSFVGLSAGSYTIRVKDSNGCVSSF